MYRIINFQEPVAQKGLYFYEKKFYISDGTEIYHIGDGIPVNDLSQEAHITLDKDDVFYLGSKPVEIVPAQGKNTLLVPMSIIVKIERSKDFDIQDQSVQITIGTQILGEFKNTKNGDFLINLDKNQVKMTQNTSIYVKLSKDEDPVSGTAKFFFKIIYKVVQWNT